MRAGVLLMLAGGSNLGLFEVNEAADVITQAAHPDANIIFGAVIDDSLGDEVKVTVIAAGFDKSEPLEQQGQFLPSRADAGRPARSASCDDEDDDEDEVFRADPPRSSAERSASSSTRPTRATTGSTSPPSCADLAPLVLTGRPRSGRPGRGHGPGRDRAARAGRRAGQPQPPPAPPAGRPRGRAAHGRRRDGDRAHLAGT